MKFGREASYSVATSSLYWGELKYAFYGNTNITHAADGVDPEGFPAWHPGHPGPPICIVVKFAPKQRLKL